MSLAETLPPLVRDRLPSEGEMGILRARRPSLYWLMVLVGGTAFVGVILALFYALALLPLVGAQAIVAVASGDPVQAAAWIVLLATVGGLVVAVVYLAARWVSQFGRSEVSE